MRIKIAALMLALAAVIGLGGCGAKETNGTLVVGTVTAMSGDFMPGFSNNAADTDVIRLIHGYSTIAYRSESGDYGVDESVVESFGQKMEEDGRKTFTFKLCDDLLWSDGTPVTARDYVFAVLLMSSAQFADIDGDTTAYDMLDGYDYFSSGENVPEGYATPLHRGVVMTDEHSFSITVSSDKLPYFYDLVYASVQPLPLSVIAPGAELISSASGSAIGGGFDSALLESSLLDAEAGYRYHPSVTCGPYTLKSFDSGSTTAALSANTGYKGNYRGDKPKIESIIIRSVTSATMLDELSRGSVDLLAGISGGEAIKAGLDLCDSGKASYNSYPRAGFGMISFICDTGPTASAAVRKAIACCIDTPEFARQYSGGYAEVVYGHYGAAQWMYRENRTELGEGMDTYAFDLERAAALLDADGWNKNAEGGEWSGGLRYKEAGGELIPCTVYWCNTPDNEISKLISQSLPANMEAVGMRLVAETVDFPVLLQNYQRKTPMVKYNMYNLAVAFTPVYDPSYNFSADPSDFGYPNSNCLADEMLYRLALEMKHTAPEEREEYSEKWLQFQLRWNELLPVIPLYSDEYHDFYTTRLKSYSTDAFYNWSYAVVSAELE